MDTKVDHKAGEKRTITREFYLQLVGLMALDERHNKALAEIADEIYGPRCSADDPLARLDIAVESADER